MTRCTVTDVAWLTLAHPVAAAGAGEAEADDVGAEDAGADDAGAEEAGADDEAPAPLGAEAVTDAHPASTEHSSTASTVPRTWRGDIMVF
jgi:hypothetical protein